MMQSVYAEIALVARSPPAVALSSLAAASSASSSSRFFSPFATAWMLLLVSPLVAENSAVSFSRIAVDSLVTFSVSSRSALCITMSCSNWLCPAVSFSPVLPR